MTTYKLQVIHLQTDSPYAPCGARLKIRGAIRAHKRIKFRNYSSLAREVSCDNCRRTAPYWRAAISQIYGATLIRAVREEFFCPDPQSCAHVRVGSWYPMLCERSRVHDVYPEPDGYWPYGEWKEDQDQPTHIIVPYTGYSDYSGGGAERSNNRALREDYPGTFTDCTGGYGTSELILSLSWRHPNGDDFTESLVQALNQLSDYPLYDEQDHSMLEMEVADEAWEAFLKYDVPRQLGDAAESGEAMEDALEALEELDDYANSCFGPREQFPRETLRNLFYESLRETDSYPYLESATSIVFPDMDTQMSWINDRIWELRCQDNPQIPAWFNPDQPILQFPGFPPIRGIGPVIESQEI